MITSTTSNKLAEIIRDTWPNLYRPPADFKPPSHHTLKNDATLTELKTLVENLEAL